MTRGGDSCQHCGGARPFRWIGGFHCRESGEPFTYGANGWYQPERSGRWPTDWPGYLGTPPLM